MFSGVQYAISLTRNCASCVAKVIEMMDKAGSFDENDEKLVGMLAAHMGAFMRQLSEGNKGREYEEAQPMHPLSASDS